MKALQRLAIESVRRAGVPAVLMLLMGGVPGTLAAPVAITGSAAAVDAAESTPPAKRPPSAKGARTQGRYGKLPAHFEVNAGQLHESVKFGARGNGYQLALTGNEMVLSLHKSRGVPADPVARREWLRKSSSERSRAPKEPPTIVRKSFVGANSNPAVVGEDPLPGMSHYLIGNDPARWHKNIRHFAKVRYQNLYPGIDLLYYGTDGRVEYDWIVAPGADPHRIVESFSGATGLQVLPNGDLFVKTAQGGFRQKKPVMYQAVGGKRVGVEGSYVALGADQAGFKVGRYNESLPLIIDPVLEYSSLLDGTFEDFATGIAVNAAGEAYVTGHTDSSDFPHTASVLAPATDFIFDIAFVTKLSAAGDSIVYSIYFGSFGETFPMGIALGPDGSAYVAGRATCFHDPTPPNNVFPGAEFPGASTIGNVDQKFENAFVVKITPDGSGFAYATLIGGTNLSFANSIALDAAGSAFVAGFTFASDFPTTTGAFQTSRSSTSVNSWDSFILKLSPDGAGLGYSTLYGGADLPGSVVSLGQTTVNGIAIDTAGNAYIAGTTNSPFLPLASAFQSAYVGFEEGFFAKIDPTGSSLVYSSYYSDSRPRGIAVDSQGNALIAGFGNPVVKVNQTGSVSFAASLGGGVGNAVAVDRLGSIYVTGVVSSNSLSPIVGDLGLEGGTDGNTDAFIAKLSADGSTFAYSFPFGGSANGSFVDSGNAIAVDPLGGAYVAGQATQNFPATAIQSGHLISDTHTAAFVVKFFEPLPAIGMFSSLNPSVVGQEVIFTAIVPKESATGTVTFFDGPTSLATVPLVAGVAKFTTSTLSIAIHPMTAVYSGDANNPTATSGVFKQEVTPPPQDSQTVLSATSTSLPANQQLGLTATVTGTSGSVPTGLVMFVDGTSRVQTAPLASGSASITIFKPTPGQRSFTARYLGDGRNNPSVSAPVSVNVIGPPDVSISAPFDRSVFATPATINITVSASSPAGASVVAVDLFLNGAPLASFTMPPYTFAWANAPPGTYVLTAVATDNFFQVSTSAPVRVQLFDASLTFFHHDLQGNVIATTDGLGQVQYTETYLPFGDRVIKDPSSQVAQNSGNRLWFHGKAQDEGTGLQFFGARYYDPVVGRFMGVDSAGFNESNLHSFNRYAYGNNNPYRYMDPDGKFSLAHIAAASVVFIGITIAVAANSDPKVKAQMVKWLSNIFHNEAENSNETPGTGQVTSSGSDSAAGKDSANGGGGNGCPNPNGCKGKQDHQDKVGELGDRARGEAKEGETVLENKKIRGYDSNRRPDQQIVDENGRTRQIYEAERKPNSKYNRAREAEYNRLGVPHQTIPLD